MTIEQLKKLDKPQIIEEILAESLALGFDMSSEPLTGSLLKTLAASKPGGRFLELGSGAGLSTSWILSGMDEASSLVTVDYDQALLDILKRHLGHDQRLEVVCQDGMTLSPPLKDANLTSFLPIPGVANTAFWMKPWLWSKRVVSISLTICCPRTTGQKVMKKRPKTSSPT